MRTLLEDLRWGFRILCGSPGLTLTAIVTLALGIAANTTVFSWIDGVLLEPIPGASNSSELATLEGVTPTGELQNTSYRDYRDYRDGLRQVSGLAASLLNVFTIGGELDPKLVWGEFVSSNYFSVMGVKAITGRTFLSEEVGDAPGGPAVAIISDRLWTSLFQRDPKVIGRTLRVNGRELTIIGVVPPDFRGAVPGLLLEMWLPVSLAPEMNGQGAALLDSRSAREMWITARLRPDVGMEQARAEVTALARRISEAEPNSSRGFSATLVPVWRGHLGAQELLRTPLQILMGVCLLLFLIVGANVANLQLARSAVRQKEFSIRLALGAGPTRLVRQVLTESLLLSAAGAVGGTVLAMWGRQVLYLFLPPVKLPFEFGSTKNWHILVFVILLCVAGAVLTGLAPALYSAHTGVIERLKESTRGSTSGAGARRTRSLLVISEVALAMVALIGTGVLIRRFYEARALDPGMDTRNVACAKYYVETFCKTGEERQRFCTRLADRLRQAPGVTGVAYTNFIPLEFGDGSTAEIEVEGYAPSSDGRMRALNSSVSPGYFAALGIPLLEGRDFREQDDTETARVMIVNQSFARRYFGGGPAVGRKVRAPHGEWFTVVGMVRDSKYRKLTEGPTPFFYTACRQMSGGEFWMGFFVRTAAPVTGALPTLGREAGAAHPATRGSDFAPYEEWIGAALYTQKIAAALVGLVGAISLLLSAIGLYSVLAFAVSQRTNEFGIRIALGARSRHVLSSVLRQGFGLTAAGLVVGALLARFALQVSSTILPNLKADDPVVFASAMVVLVTVGCLASYLPAQQATKVDPVVALRQE